MRSRQRQEKRSPMFVYLRGHTFTVMSSSTILVNYLYLFNQSLFPFLFIFGKLEILVSRRAVLVYSCVSNVVILALYQLI